jgi:MFS family permease
VTSARGLRAFRHYNYRIYFVGQLISLVGTWMQQVAQGWLVLQLTNDPLWLGLVAVAQFGPVLVLGLFGGLIADQLPKRRTLIATQTVAMILAFVLFGLTVTGIVEVWHVLLLSVLLGVTNSFDMPARQSFAVEMVGRADVANAVGLNAATFNLSRILGPAAAGLLIGAVSISFAFLVNGISFIAVIVGYLLMRESELRPTELIARPTSLRGIFDNLAEGGRYVRRTPIVLLAVVVVGLASTFGMNFQVLIPPLADDVLHVGASGFGFLMAASGLGSTIAALGVAFQRRINPYAIVFGAILLGLSLIVLALSGSFAVSLVAMFFAGFGAIGMAVTANTSIQLLVPDQLRGRVMSVYTTTFAGSVPAGGLISGAIASSWGVPASLVAGAVPTLVVGVVALGWLRGLRRAERDERAVTAERAIAASADPLRIARRQ